MIATALLLALAGAPAAVQSPVRVQPRVLEKEGHAFLSAGLGYLARGDYYDNPALTGVATYYFSARDGLELQLAWFLSSLNPGAREVFDRTGLVPESHRQLFHGLLGWRRSLGYGKVLVERQDPAVVHFDFQGIARAGLAFTDKGANPMLAIGPGLLFRYNDQLVVQLDTTFQASVEQRMALAFPLGVQAALTVGVRL